MSIFLAIRSSKALRKSEEHQKDGTGRIDRSIEMQAEALEIVKAEHETFKQMLAEILEIKGFLAEIKKELEQKER